MPEIAPSERRRIIYGQVCNKDLSRTLIDFKQTWSTIVIVPNQLKKMTCKICLIVKLYLYFFILEKYERKQI